MTYIKNIKYNYKNKILFRLINLIIIISDNYNN